MFHTRKFISIFALLALLALTFAAPVSAFDGRGGDKVVVQTGEVINDDLYVGTNEFVLDGTVNGDVVAFGTTITINGTINGDLIAAGQTIIVNGAVTDDARIAGSVLFIGENAKIGSDLVSAGYSLETRAGSSIGQDVVYAGGQSLMAGGITRNLQVATGALELRGTVGGNVKAEVGEAEGNPPFMFPQQSAIPAPIVRPGLAIDPEAKIDGNLEYTQTKDLTFPAGVVGGQINRIVPQVNEAIAKRMPTSVDRAGKWALDLIRTIVTLILFGLLLGWLFPKFMSALPERIKSQPWPSLGWGAIAWAVFFFALFAIVLAMILGGTIFGVLTLGSISGMIIWLGILLLFALIVGFVLATAFVSKIIVGTALGKWIFSRSSLAEHKFWPMIVGVTVIAVVVALFRFPLLPTGFIGWLINFIVVLLGLGTLWLWGRDNLRKQPVS
jgi:cytoskeletal protein CcmA (bactofilin family)/F0F1-type ATP synthase assembly protein I